MVKKEEENNSGTGYEDGQSLLFSTTARFCDIKHATKQLTFVFTFDYNN